MIMYVINVILLLKFLKIMLCSSFHVFRHCFHTYFMSIIYVDFLLLFFRVFCFLCDSVFIHVNHYHLSYLTVRICETILMMMFSLITIKTFIFCEMSFLFI